MSSFVKVSKKQFYDKMNPLDVHLRSQHIRDERGLVGVQEWKLRGLNLIGKVETEYDNITDEGKGAVTYFLLKEGE